MKKIIFITVAVGYLLSMTSCSKNLTYFTQDLYEENQWSENELRRIQFYVSEDIVLYRTASGGTSRIEDGKIEIKDRQKVDEIVIKRGTPGTVVFIPKEDKYGVSFDDSGAFLIFGPGKNTLGRYTLKAKSWRENRRGGVITYDGQEYFTSSQSAYASLMVDLRKARKSTVTKSTASGRKI